MIRKCVYSKSKEFSTKLLKAFNYLDNFLIRLSVANIISHPNETKQKNLMSENIIGEKSNI